MVDGREIVTVTAEFVVNNDNTSELQVTVKDRVELTKDILAEDFAAIKQVYEDGIGEEKKKEVLSLDWKDVFSSDDYGAISGYEIEYRLYDESGAIRGASATASVVVTLGGKETSYDIQGVVNNSIVEWRVRVLGDKSVTKWSDWKLVTNEKLEEGVEGVTTYTEDSINIEAKNLAPKVIDAVKGESNDVVAAIAEVSWNKIQSDKPIRYYVVQYCTRKEQITLQDVLDYNEANGTEYTLEGFIANVLEMEHTKVITGTQVAISNLQNQSYLYWKIQAVDVEGHYSDWVAGQTARVWANTDTVDPVFAKDATTSFVVGYKLPDPDAPVGEKTQVFGAIGWNAAIEQESGVRRYDVYMSTDGGKTYTLWKPVQSEDKQIFSFGNWVDSGLDADTEYRVSFVDGDKTIYSQAASVSVKIDGGLEIKTLNWYFEGNTTGSAVTVEYWDKKANEWKTFSTVKDSVYSMTLYDYIVKLDDLTDPQYNFYIEAVDYFGNKSNQLNVDPIILDSKAPAFSSDRCNVSWTKDTSNPEKITITPTLSWSYADDYTTDQGVRYYEVFYREQGKKEWMSVYVVKQPENGSKDDIFSYTFEKALAAQTYEYKIVAYDYFGRTDEIQGTFGSSDVKPPEGSFDEASFTAKVTASVTKNYVEVEDDDGEITSYMVGYTIDSARVVLDWDDTFRDSAGVIYKITISDNAYCNGENTYEFWTASNSGSTFTLDNSTPGCPVGILEGMDTVYWFVEVYDGNYNQGFRSEIKSFKFQIDDEEIKTNLVAGQGPAQPRNIEYKLNMEDNCHTDVVGLSWVTDNTCVGIYSYTIELKNSKGEVVYSGSTLDVSDKLATDINPMVQVTNLGSSSKMSITDLRKFFGETVLEDGNYKVVITAIDAAGRKTKSSQKVDFSLDTVRPPVVDVIEYGASGTSANGEAYSTLYLKWNHLEDVSGIDYYIVSYRRQAYDGPGEWQETIVGKDCVKTVDGKKIVVFEMDADLADTYDFRIVAIDNAGNRGYEWASDTVINIKPLGDKYSDAVNKNVAKLEFDDNGVLKVADTVGRGDVADCFSIETQDKSMAINLTAEDLGLVLGKNQSVKIDIYEVPNGTPAEQAKALKKVWKSYTVKADGLIIADLLCQANTTYTFKVSASSKDSIADYDLALVQKVLGGAGNDNSDDVYSANMTVTNLTEEEAVITRSDWVGYGDAKDIQAIKVDTTGKYIFTLKDVAADATLTVYEVVNGVAKKLTSVVGKASNLNGVTTQELVLTAGKEYYYEIKINKNNVIGTGYNVEIEQVDNYSPATLYDNNPYNKNWDPQVLQVGSSLEEDKDMNALWVGSGDEVDYFKLTDESVKNLVKNKEYQLKLDGFEGNSIKVAIGYFDEKGNFKIVASKTGVKGTSALSMYCKFDYDDLCNGQLFVQVTANKNGNSRYTIAFNEYADLADKTDDTAAMTETELLPGNTMTDWVGYGDDTDFVKLSVDDDGLYQIALNGAENNITLTVLQKVVAVNGSVSYITIDTVKASGSNSDVEGKQLVLDAGKEYYVSVNAPGAKKGNDSDYELTLNQLGSAVDLGNYDVYNENEEIVINGAKAQNRIFTAAENGGGYEFSINNTNATGAVTLTVYELLDNGKTRKVKSITVKAGTAGSTGYLWLDDSVVANGTGIYQVEVKGGNKVSGNVELTVNGYSVQQYMDLKDDAYNEFGVKNWVGSVGAFDGYNYNGDVYDIYNYDVYDFNTGVHEFKLDGINGSNVKVSVVDRMNKVLKSFTVTAGSTSASFAYDFATDGEYKIVVESAGKNSFSEYILDYVDRTEDVAKWDNSTAMLGTPDSWDAADCLSDANDIEGWVGFGDASDYYGVIVNESGNYDLNISGIYNDVKVTLYEVTSYAQTAINKSKEVKSVTVAAANGGAVLSGVYLNANSDYYVVVQAGSSKDSKSTEYSLNLSMMDEAAEIQSGKIGGANTSDAYTFVAVDGATDITLDIADADDKAVVTIYKVNTATGKYTKVSSLTASGKSMSVSTGDLCLEAGSTYVMEVTAPNAKNGATVDYTLKVNNWEFSASVTDNNEYDTATELVVSNTVSSAVWKTGDMVDYFKVDIVNGGSYSLDMTGINGNNVKVSIGTVVNGKFKSLQSVTGAKGAESLLLSHTLDANTSYYIKVEANGSNSASEYTMQLTNNHERVIELENGDSKALLNNADDTWKLVAGDINSASYGDADTITDWVGFGDAADVFKIRLDEIENGVGNGQVVFSGIDDTADALIDKELSLSLVDANGKSVALTFDKVTGNYTSKEILMAGVDYYLTVKNSNEKKQNIDYSIDINLA